MTTARYLNVDCILRSDGDLSRLVSTLKEDVFVLWNEPSNDGSYVGLETNLVNTNGPDEDISEFIRLFELRSLHNELNLCQEKIFDIGFESGDIGDPIDVKLDNELIRRISELGFSLKIRVYPVNLTEIVET